MHRNRVNVIPYPVTSRRSLRRAEVASCVCRVWQGEGCDRKTPGYGGQKTDGQVPTLPKWHSKDSADTLEAQRHHCISTRTNTISARNAICAPHSTQWHWGSWKFLNRMCAMRICVLIFLVPTFSVSIVMHTRRIASVIKIFFQISWPMKEPQLVGTQSAVWYWAWHGFCRWEETIKGTWKWTRA